MFEFDLDEDELILDDYENEVFLSFFYEVGWDRCNLIELSVYYFCVKYDSLGLIVDRNFYLFCVFWKEYRFNYVID